MSSRKIVFHSLQFRVFANATEDEKKVIKALQFVTGTEQFRRSVTLGYHGNPKTIFESTLNRSHEINSFFVRWRLEDLERVLETLPVRIDENGFIFFRFDKQEAFYERLILSEGEDVIAVKGKIMAYPSTWDRAVEVAREYFTQLIEVKRIS